MLTSHELSIQIRALLHTPVWKSRLVHIHGSVLRDKDLERAK